MSNVEKLKERLPNLVEQYSNLSKEDLLEACCGEILDLLQMQKRVSLFMEECTHMSYTTYPIETLRQMITERKESDIDEWCSYFIEDEQTDEDIIEEVRKRGSKFLK